MSIALNARIKDLINHYMGCGISVWIDNDFVLNELVVTAKNTKDDLHSRHRIRSDVPEDELAHLIHRVAAKVAVGGARDSSKDDIVQLKAELDKYKAAVKQLAFDLEMAQSTSRSSVDEKIIRKFALEQAADYLMDHGCIRTGAELEQVCDQIRKLHPSKDVTMNQAAARMQAFFGGLNGK